MVSEYDAITKSKGPDNSCPVMKKNYWGYFGWVSGV
jgi:hypothetical protein